MQGACKVPGPDTLNEVALIAESIELEESLGSVGGWFLFYNRLLQHAERSTRHTRYRPLTKVHALGLTDTPQTPTRWHAEAHQPDLPSLSKAPHT